MVAAAAAAVNASWGGSYCDERAAGTLGRVYTGVFESSNRILDAERVPTLTADLYKLLGFRANLGTGGRARREANCCCSGGATRGRTGTEDFRDSSEEPG
jgi:hypothetical protein